MPKSAPKPYLQKFFAAFPVAASEQALVAQCLQKAIDHFYASHEYSQHWWSDAQLVQYPEILGQAAVLAIRHPTLTVETKLQLVRVALHDVSPVLDRHLPAGLLPILSFLTQMGLTVPQFALLLGLVNIGTRDWYADWLPEECQQLYHWLMAVAPLAAPDRVWWVWYLLAHCDNKPRLGYELAAYCIAHPGWAMAEKQTLAEALLQGKGPTPVPAHWQMVQALLRGDETALAAALQRLPPADQPVWPTPTPPPAEFEADGPSLAFIRYGFGEDWVYQPPYLRKAGLRGLVALGTDPLTLCETQLITDGTNTAAEAVNTGIAEILRAHHAHLPLAAVLGVIDRALQVTSVPTRKAFYQLGYDLYGESFLVRAAHDNAVSLRQWAAQAATPRSRKKRGAE